MCDAHLHNVPAGKMTADPEDPQGFTKWLAGRGRAVAPTAFLPRWLFGSYLGEHLAAASREYAATASLACVWDRAIGVSRRPEGMSVELASGRCVRAGAVVLAL